MSSRNWSFVVSNWALILLIASWRELVVADGLLFVVRVHVLALERYQFAVSRTVVAGVAYVGIDCHVCLQSAQLENDRMIFDTVWQAEAQFEDDERRFCADVDAPPTEV